MNKSLKIKPCPVCDVGQMHYQIKAVKIHCRGLSAKVPAVAGWHCDSCEEIDFDETTDSGDRWAAAGDQLVHQVRMLRLD